MKRQMLTEIFIFLYSCCVYIIEILSEVTSVLRKIRSGREKDQLIIL